MKIERSIAGPIRYVLGIYAFLFSLSLWGNTVSENGKGRLKEDLPHNWHLLDNKWDGLIGISLDEAYDLVKGKKSVPVVVGVLSNGIDTTHEDIKGNLWINKGEIVNNGKDDDGNGYIDDKNGFNFLYDKIYETTPGDITAFGSCPQGTRIAGLVGANRRNKRGIEGIVDSVRLMAIRSSIEFNFYDYIKSMSYAIDNGAKIIITSATPKYSDKRNVRWKKSLDSIIDVAARKNVLVVQGIKASRGESLNIDQDSIYYVPNKENFISVGVSYPLITDQTPWRINYGKKKVDVFAPGYRIFSSLPTGFGDEGIYGYYGAEASVNSAAIVGGIAAFILSYYPTMSAKEVKQIIIESVETMPEQRINIGEGQLFSLTELCKSGGIVNAFNAMKLAQRTKLQ